MLQQDWEDAIATPTLDGRVYRPVPPAELATFKGCLIKAKRFCGYGEYKFYAGGILHHVDVKNLQYLYIRIPGTKTTFPLPIPECEFWVLPMAATEDEIQQWVELLEASTLKDQEASTIKVVKENTKQ